MRVFIRPKFSTRGYFKLVEPITYDIISMNRNKIYAGHRIQPKSLHAVWHIIVVMRLRDVENLLAYRALK